MKRQLRYFFCLVLLAAMGAVGSIQAQCGTFYDGFETGTIGPQWTFGTGSYTRTVPNTNSAVGTYHLQQSGSGSFYQGMYATFTPSQPTYISFWMRTNITNAPNGYMVIGDGYVATDNGILFCFFNSTSQLSFFNNTGSNYNITANTWYHVEAKNINWTTRTMDIWINNVLYLTAWAFRSSLPTNIDRIHMFNLSASDAKYDHIQIGLGGPVISNPITVDPLCFGDSTGSVDITASSTNGIGSYGWSNGASTQDIQNVPGGVYALTVTDSLGCTSNASYTLTSPTQIAPIGTPTNVLCPGGGSGALDLSVTGGSSGYSYLWSSGDTTQDLSNITAGQYAVTVTDLNGCESQNNFAVTEPSPFLDSSLVSDPTCINGNDGMIDFSLTGGSGGYSYLWTTGDTTEDVGGLSAGIYAVIVTDTLGCSYQDSFTLVNPASMLTNSTIGTPSCFSYGNGFIDLTPSGGTPVYTYLWSTGATSQNLPSATAGSYTVTVTDANGCEVVDSFLVTEPTAVVSSGIVTNSTGSNNGGVDLTVTGGTPPYTYLWSNSSSAQDLSGVAGNANYTVLITDANGCQITDTFFVDEVIAVTNALGTQFSAYPNPFTRAFVVDLKGIGAEPVTLSLTDLAGREVWKTIHSVDGKVEFADPLANGVYLLRLIQGTETTTLKMIKQ
ncbi:MAG: hypothetical protein RLZZ519_1897 [Bacteroidota bacterium]